MSSFEQDDGTFYQSTNNNSSNNNSTNSEDGSTTTKIPRPKVQFGLLELGIFVLIWVALLVSFKAYNKKSRSKYIFTSKNVYSLLYYVFREERMVWN